MQDMLLESLQRFLADNCTPAAIRRYEKGESTAALWAELEGFGYADALRPEDSGGAGLGLREIRELIVLLGRMPAPVPLAETMLARALLDGSGELPSGPIVLSSPVRTPTGELLHAAVPLARTAEFALVELDNQWLLTPLAEAEVTATGVNASLAADIRWKQKPRALLATDKKTASLRAIAATLRAAQMVGAMRQLLEMTLEYAGTRKQFGKALAELQAIQQQLAVMAELVLGADMAVQMAFAESGVAPQPLLAALAKQSASAAAPRVAATAHAVHGAIGLSEEFDLQLYSRRLHEWRLADGSDAYWSRQLGAARVGHSGNSVDFIRAQLSPTTAE